MFAIYIFKKKLKFLRTKFGIKNLIAVEGIKNYSGALINKFSKFKATSFKF